MSEAWPEVAADGVTVVRVVSTVSRSLESGIVSSVQLKTAFSAANPQFKKIKEDPELAFLGNTM